VYNDADIILMDDPISALDANVRKKIFKEVFQGMLKYKTRVLVTHAVDFLHLADRIVVVKDGSIQSIGSFDEMQNDPHLKEVLKIQR
jgi:ABC-type proline/glycine betaine transport system ATPase subunit